MLFTKKYHNQFVSNEKIENLINENERIIWRGRPKKISFILNKILSMTPFAILWLAFDATFITLMVLNVGRLPTPIIIFLVIFFAFHLIPVWLWISRIIFAWREYRFTEYAITDRRVLVKTGIVAAGYLSFYYNEIRNIEMHIGIIDRLTGVGDIFIHCGKITSAKVPGFLDIEDPYSVYKILEKATRDIATDINFPNAYRPDTNEGYKTDYKDK